MKNLKVTGPEFGGGGGGNNPFARGRNDPLKAQTNTIWIKALEGFVRFFFILEFRTN